MGLDVESIINIKKKGRAEGNDYGDESHNTGDVDQTVCLCDGKFLYL